MKTVLKWASTGHIMEGCIIDPGHCFLITLGDNVCLAPRVHLLAHDASTKQTLGYTKIGLVNIGSGCFIGANSTVLPGVTIGKGSIVGANSLVSKDIPEGSVYAGNPAKFICSAEDYFDNMEKMMKTAPIFDDSYTIL
ncbi:MAG: acyltransferase, partial [Clostridiales bacterium]|nr:acyltransferase [Clostridiales bacterium]